MVRKLNPDRARRYIARSTPDTMQFRLDQMSDTFEHDYAVKIDAFIRRMRLKYGKEIGVDIYADRDLGRFPGEVMYFARAYVREHHAMPKVTEYIVPSIIGGDYE